MSVPPSWLGLKGKDLRSHPHPPTIFMHMPDNDFMTAEGVAQDLKALQLMVGSTY